MTIWPRSGARQSGGHRDHRCFTGSRLAEQCRDSSLALEFHGQFERALAPVQGEVEHHPSIRRATRRARISEASRAIIATTTEMMHKRMAPASPLGT